MSGSSTFLNKSSVMSAYVSIETITFTVWLFGMFDDIAIIGFCGDSSLSIMLGTSGWMNCCKPSSFPIASSSVGCGSLSVIGCSSVCTDIFYLACVADAGTGWMLRPWAISFPSWNMYCVPFAVVYIWRSDGALLIA